MDLDSVPNSDPFEVFSDGDLEPASFVDINQQTETIFHASQSEAAADLDSPEPFELDEELPPQVLANQDAVAEAEKENEIEVQDDLPPPLDMDALFRVEPSQIALKTSQDDTPMLEPEAHADAAGYLADNFPVNDLAAATPALHQSQLPELHRETAEPLLQPMSHSQLLPSAEAAVLTAQSNAVPLVSNTDVTFKDPEIQGELAPIFSPVASPERTRSSSPLPRLSSTPKTRSPTQAATTPPSTHSSPSAAPKASTSKVTLEEADLVRQLAAEEQQDQHIATGGRALRKRNAKQLAPYSLEQARYIATLNKNQWEDAVVKIKRRELTAEELAERKQRQLETGQDDLEGWLELEDGMQKRTASDEEFVAPPEPVYRPKKRKKILNPQEERDKQIRRALRGSYSSSSAESEADAQQPSAVVAGARSNPTKSYKPKPVSSSARPKAFTSMTAPPKHVETNKSKKRSEGSTSASSDRKSRKHTTLSLTDSGSSDDGSSRHRSVSRPLSVASDSDPDQLHGGPSARKRTSKPLAQGDWSDEDEPMPDRYKLAGKRKKHLKGMMPGVFLRKAEKDLKLMAQEKRHGRDLVDLEDYGSADEEEGSVEDAKGKVVIRKKPALSEQPLILEGDGFTEGSSEDDVVVGRQSNKAINVDSDSEEEQQDSLAGWLISDTRQREKIKQGADFIDRLLTRRFNQSKRKSTKSLKRRRIAPPNNKASSRVSHTPLEDSTNVQHSDYKHRKRKSQDLDDLTSRTKSAISLADEDALFCAKSNPLTRRPRQPVATVARPPNITIHSSSGIPSLDVDTILPYRKEAPRQQDEFSTFRQFSPDFNLTTLPVGTSFEADSYIRRGRLLDLLTYLRTPLASEAPIRSVQPFGIALDSDLAFDDLVFLMDRVFDGIFEHYRKIYAKEDSATLDHCINGLSFISQYLPRCISASSSETVIINLSSYIDRLQSRINALEKSEEAFTAEQFQAMLPVDWALCELAFRLRASAQARVGASHDTPSPTHQLQRLIHSLIEYGMNRTGKSIKLAMEGRSSDWHKDSSIEIWACIIHLCLASDEIASPTMLDLDIPSTALLWTMVEEELGRTADTDNIHPLVASEAVSYSAMVLCAISTFSSSGFVSGKARLFANWSILVKTLERVSINGVKTARGSRSETSRRDGYIWALFSRVLVFATRWNWPLDTTQVIPRLYAILNAREFSNLSVDLGRDFPVFLQSFEGSIDTKLDSASDSCFHIFLKLLYLVIEALPGATAQDKQRNIYKFLMRINPTRKLPFTKDDHPLTSDRSMLTNHYALFIFYSILSPTTSAQRLGQAKNLLAFEKADDVSRPIQIQAFMYFGITFQKLSVPVTPVLDWFAAACEYLLQQYHDLEKRRAKAQAPPEKSAVKGMSIVINKAEKDRELRTLAEHMHSVVLSISMILRALQHIMLAKASLTNATVYPEASFTNPAWTTHMLKSSISHDPLAGIEILKCLQCFLGLRSQVIQPVQTNDFSQDEFGMDDIDFDDPALNNLIGFDANAAKPGAPADVAVKDLDKAFASIVKDQISPAIYGILSTIFTPEITQRRSAPTVVATRSALREEYVSRLVKCWIGCISVLVDNGMKTWSTYLNFGTESVNRIPSREGVREVSLYFACELSRLDQTAFSANIDDFITIWCENIVFIDCIAQHTLSTCILRALSDRDALFGGLLKATGLDEDTYEMSAADLSLHRRTILKNFFSNVNRILLGNTVNVERVPARGVVFKLFGNLFTAMRDNLDSFNERETSKKEAYAAFCRRTLDSLKHEIGDQVNERTVVALRLLSGVGEAPQPVPSVIPNV